MRSILEQIELLSREDIEVDKTIAAETAELSRLLNPRKVPEFEATATTGQGVFDTLKAIAKLVLQELKKGSA